MNRTPDAREAQAELLTAALLVLVVGLFLLGNIPESWAVLAAGLILLGSAVYQTLRGWHVSLVTWIAGGLLTLGGLGVRLYLVGVMRISWTAVALIAIGGYLLLRWLARR